MYYLKYSNILYKKVDVNSVLEMIESNWDGGLCYIIKENLVVVTQFNIFS